MENSGGSTDHGGDVAAMPDGGFVVAGYEFIDDLNVVTTAGEYKWLRRYDAAGAPVWTKQAPTVPRGRGVTVAFSGEVVYFGGCQQSSAWLRAYNQGGAELWTIGPDGPGSSCSYCEYISDLVPLPSGGVVAAGRLDGASDSDAWIARIASDSTEQWSELHDSGDNDYPRGIGVDAAENVLVLVNKNNSAYLRKYDSDGNLLWHLDDPVTVDGYSTDLAVAADGGFVIVGTEFVTPTNQDAIVTRFDADGSKLWETTWSSDDSSRDGVGGVAFTSTGQVIVAGTTAPSTAAMQTWSSRCLRRDGR